MMTNSVEVSSSKPAIVKDIAVSFYVKLLEMEHGLKIEFAICH